jgi:hypothetical protein
MRIAIVLVLSVALSACASAPPGARVTQPVQRTTGPGGSDLPARGVRESSGGTGADAWYVFEPIRPAPRSAPVAIVMHGYGEFSGFATMSELVRHTALSGSVVVYPRWQTGVVDPCPGPFDIEPCMAAASNGIRGALRFLQADRHRVQPELDRASYFGFSFGGIVTVNLANRARELGLPEPRAVFLDDPHDGGLSGTDEPAVDDALSGIPAATLLVCHVGAEGVIAEPTMEDASCNAIFPKLVSIPKRNKNLVLTHPDAHGEPPLVSAHGVCTSHEHLDAYDWNFCWKVWDALRSAADGHGTDRRFALGNTPEQRNNGRWSDGTPITPLEVRDAAPIRP